MISSLKHVSVLRILIFSFTSVCSFQTFNLVFLIDGSGSIEQQGLGNFQRTKDFVISVIKSFDVSRGGTNVAVVLFASVSRIIFPLDRYYHKNDMIQAVQDNVTRHAISGGRHKYRSRFGFFCFQFYFSLKVLYHLNYHQIKIQKIQIHNLFQ